MKDCVFCKIAKGEIPSEKVFENGNFIVIKDVHPRTRGHSLVIPKKHYRTLLDMPCSLYGEFLEVTKESAFKLLKQEKAEGFNLVMNNFKPAGQIVEHVHLHIIPRTNEDGFKLNV